MGYDGQGAPRVCGRLLVHHGSKAAVRLVGGFFTHRPGSRRLAKKWATCAVKSAVVSHGVVRRSCSCRLGATV